MQYQDQLDVNKVSSWLGFTMSFIENVSSPRVRHNFVLSPRVRHDIVYVYTVLSSSLCHVLFWQSIYCVDVLYIRLRHYICGTHAAICGMHATLCKYVHGGYGLQLKTTEVS